jgi:hypothetical protein
VASRTARGDYLGSNQYLDAALAKSREALNTQLASQRRRTLADYAGQAAGARSAFARSGMQYGTASTQAEQASKAALLARLGESEAVSTGNLAEAEAQQRAQNYQLERQRQIQSPAMLEAATTGPAALYSTAAQNYLAPEAQAAQIVQGLSGGGQIATPQSAYIKKPGALDYTMGFLSSLSGGGMQGGGGGW